MHLISGIAVAFSLPAPGLDLTQGHQAGAYWFLVVVWSLSCIWLCDPMDCSTPAALSSTISQSLLKFMSIESVMVSNHLILHCLLLLLPLIVPSGSLAMSWLFHSTSFIQIILCLIPYSHLLFGWSGLIYMSRNICWVFNKKCYKEEPLYSITS